MKKGRGRLNVAEPHEQGVELSTIVFLNISRMDASKFAPPPKHVGIAPGDLNNCPTRPGRRLGVVVEGTPVTEAGPLAKGGQAPAHYREKTTTKPEAQQKQVADTKGQESIQKT